MSCYSKVEAKGDLFPRYGLETVILFVPLEGGVLPRIWEKN